LTLAIAKKRPKNNPKHQSISFAGAKIRARLYFDTTIEANPATPEFGTANDTLFSNIGRSFSAFPVLS